MPRGDPNVKLSDDKSDSRQVTKVRPAGNQEQAGEQNDQQIWLVRSNEEKRELEKFKLWDSRSASLGQEVRDFISSRDGDIDRTLSRTRTSYTEFVTFI